MGCFCRITPIPDILQGSYFVWKNGRTFPAREFLKFLKFGQKVREFLKSLDKSGKFANSKKYNVFTFVNIMSLLLQCVYFQIGTVYSFVGPSNLKGFWVHYMDSWTRPDGRRPVGPCWDIDLIDLVYSHREKSTRHTLGCEHQ